MNRNVRPWTDSQQARPRDGEYVPSRLDRFVNGLVLFVIVVVLVVFACELGSARAGQIEWLTVTARLLAFDRPL